MAFSAVLTGTGQSCTLTSGQSTITVTSASGLVVGATIQGTGIPTGTRIGKIVGTTVTLVNSSGVEVTATATGTQSLIFSSVYGSVLTISQSASGDYHTPQDIYNAGFGVMSNNIAKREIFFPGALKVIWSNIVSGAVFDFLNWSLEFGVGGYWIFQESSILGELRGGYLVNGTQFIKTAGPTFYSNNWNNNGAGGSSMFESLTGTSNQGLFRMHNPRFIQVAGNNASFIFNSSRMTMTVENMILDYQTDTAGANAGIGAAFGTLKNTYLIKTNAGIAQTNGSNYATFDGIIYVGNYQSSPQHKFRVPSGYTLDGYSPQVLSSQFLGGFANSTTETYSNINLTSAGWGLNDLKTKYQRFGGPNIINFPRTVSFQLNDSTGADLTGVTLFIKSGSTELVNEVLAGDFSRLVQSLVLNWTGNVGSYRVCDNFVDTINQVAQFRKYGYIEQSVSYSLNNSTYSQPFFMLKNSYIEYISESNVQTYTNISLDYVTKKVIVSGTYTPDQLLAKINYELALPANSNVLNFVDVEGTSLIIKNNWTIDITSTGVINNGVTLHGLIIQDVQIINNGSINIPFSDIDGSRVAVTGLDPENFGVTWNLRYKLASNSSWTLLTGTGNTTTILTSLGVYDLQARVAGYTWKTIDFDTTESLSVDLGLVYHVADDGTPQYLKAYNSALVNIFEYNDVEMSVEVTNTTGAILQPGFNEMYQVIEKVQQDPTLVWFWVNPVTTNATSQKILIPPTSPLTMYLSADSNASVKITCPVVYSDTGISADDKVKGNPSGYSIILGSSATADSSLIVSQLVEQLGGQGFTTEDHSLTKIKNKVDKGLTKTQYLAYK